EDGIRAFHVTGVQTCALPIFSFHFACNAFNSFDAVSQSVLSFNSCARATNSFLSLRFCSRSSSSFLKNVFLLAKNNLKADQKRLFTSFAFARGNPPTCSHLRCSSRISFVF